MILITLYIYIYIYIYNKLYFIKAGSHLYTNTVFFSAQGGGLPNGRPRRSKDSAGGTAPPEGGRNPAEGGCFASSYKLRIKNNWTIHNALFIERDDPWRYLHQQICIGKFGWQFAPTFNQNIPLEFIAEI